MCAAGISLLCLGSEACNPDVWLSSLPHKLNFFTVFKFV